MLASTSATALGKMARSRMAIAFAFLQHRRLKKVRWGKKNQRTTPSTKLTRRPSRHRRADRSTAASAMLALPKIDLREDAA